MVLGRDIERTIRLLHTHVDKLRSWGLSSAVVYTTKEGVLKTYGTNAIKTVVENHAAEIFNADDYLTFEKANKTDQTKELDAEDNEVKVILPALDDPLDKWTFVVNISTIYFVTLK